jgi:hypothetical protein
MIMANICYTAAKLDIQMTVGRATTSGATAANSTNIVSNVNPLALPVSNPNTYMAARGGENDSDTNKYNMNGFAMDAPGAGTFYYTIWMSSSTSHNYSEMAVSLSILSI